MASADRKKDFTGNLDDANLDSHVEELLEDSIPLKEGRTNEVFEGSEGNVVKIYSDSSVSAYMDGLYRMATGTGSYPEREERIGNVQSVRQYEEDIPLNFPDIKYVSQRSVEFEKVPGKAIDQHMEELNGFRCYDMGYRLGETLETLQGEGVAMKVFSLDNIKAEGYDLHALDQEFWNESSTRRSKKMEKILILSAAKGLEPESRTHFLEGFEDAYGNLTCLDRLFSTGLRKTARKIWD